ncbi:collagen alpha-1(XXIII) chain-like [Pteropus vampyrus]|uniref:Collagen alpha-1(XXIII) chain-like n=1 Tax=Pteropus vampyrus TaxID=132908 RepID=A0A6P6CFU6_PTEVA|nr:collagen alpha-1(XXIII) chain-like [Pteropus vampyrus]
MWPGRVQSFLFPFAAFPGLPPCWNVCRLGIFTVKEEDKTLPKPGPPGKEEGALEGSSKDSSGPSRSPQPPTNSESTETKSPAPTLAMNGLGAASAEASSEETPGLSRKKVANAVRKVVSRVMPGEEPGSTRETLSRGVKSPEHPARGKRGEKAASGPKPPPPPPPPPPPKPEAKKEAAKDELSVGLRSLMSRGRGKDHKPRSRQSPGKGEKPSSQEPGSSGKPGFPEVVDSSAKPVSPTKPGTPEEQCSLAPPEELADPGSAGPKLNLTGLQQSKSPAPDMQQEAEAATEVQLTPAEEAHQRLERIFTAPVMPPLACGSPVPGTPLS